MYICTYLHVQYMHTYEYLVHFWSGAWACFFHALCDGAWLLAELNLRERNRTNSGTPVPYKSSIRNNFIRSYVLIYTHTHTCVNCIQHLTQIVIRNNFWVTLHILKYRSSNFPPMYSWKLKWFECTYLYMYWWDWLVVGVDKLRRKYINTWNWRSCN